MRDLISLLLRRILLPVTHTGPALPACTKTALPSGPQTDASVSALHRTYVTALTKLHDANKHKYPLWGGKVSELKLLE